MDFIGPILDFLRWSCFEPAAHNIGYMKNLKENFQMLQKEVQTMHNRWSDIDREIKDAGKRPTSECKGWLDEAEEINKQWEDIQERYTKDKRCLRGWCPHVSSRMNIGKLVLKLKDEVSDLNNRKDFIGGMTIDESRKVMEMPAPRIQAGTSTHRTLQEILRCIRDVNIKIVGIWGMGGVGKTTIMKNLNNHPEIAQTFGNVIWVTVSKQSSYTNMQNEVSQGLSVRREDSETDDAYARRLYQNLKDRKFLLLLDDVWDEIDLNKFGVFLGNEDSNSDCKVVLSTRDHSVCNKMRTDKDIKVSCLSDDEALSLFRMEVGKIVDSPRIKPFAKDVVKECSGLPLAIVLVGRALRKEDNHHVWRASLRQLRSPGTSEMGAMQEEIFQHLKFSLDKLRHVNLKKCFLYCALYPEGREIEKMKLIEYWRSEDLIGGWVTLVEAEDKGHKILKELMDASLLEKCHSNSCIKMHDVIRDLALTATFQDGEQCRSIVKAGEKLLQVPEAEAWEYARRISLMETDLTSLPENPICSMLRTLLLQENQYCREIPSLFFEHMSSLRVLDLSGTAIEFLPPSLGCLVNLRGLYLDNCRRLRALPPEIRCLIKLEVLHINGKHMVCYLPVEMGELAALRCLQLRLCTSWIYAGKQRTNAIPVRTLSRLSQLEQVSIYASDSSGKNWDESSRVMSEEMGILSKLNCVDLHFAKAEQLDHFILESPSWKQGQLASFRFFIGYPSCKVAGAWEFDLPESGLGNSIFDRWSGIFICKGDDNIPREINAILNHVDALLLEGLVSVRQLSKFGVENLNALKECVVVECDGIETIVNGDGLLDIIVFPHLNSLFLYTLSNLRSIWEGPLPLGRRCFTSLMYLELVECPKLTKIFPWGIIQQLSNLETLKVHDCSAMKEIIANEEELEEIYSVEFVNVLPKLKQLDVSRMIELAHICSKGATLGSWPSLEQIRIVECPNLKNLPHGIANAPNLRMISCARQWWAALESEDDGIKQQLQDKVKFY